MFSLFTCGSLSQPRSEGSWFQPAGPGGSRSAPAEAPSALRWEGRSAARARGKARGRKGKEGKGTGAAGESQRGVQSRFLGGVRLRSLLLIADVCQACHSTFVRSRSTKVIARSLPHGTHHRLPGLTPFLFHACFSTPFLPFTAFPFQPQKQSNATLHSLIANPSGPRVFGSQSLESSTGFGFKVQEVAAL